MPVDLPSCRALLERGDLAAFREVPLGWDPAAEDPNPRDPLARVERWELLGFDALHQGFPSWAFACFRAGASQAIAAAEGERARDLVALADRVLTLGFAPYTDDAEWRDDVRAWLAVQRTRPGPAPPLDGLNALRHRFTLRALRTNRDGVLLPFDRLVQRFGLSPDAASILRVLLAIAGEDPAPTVHELLRWLHLDDAHRERLRDELAPDAPLRAWGLVHLGDGPTLLLRPAFPDDAALAFLDGRAAHPEVLRGRARLVPAPDADLAYRDGARAILLQWWRRTATSAWLVVGGCSGAEAAHAVAAGLATVGVPVIAVGPGAPTPDAVTACAREARLRGAAVWIGPDRRDWAVALADLARVVPIAVVAHVAAATDLEVPLTFLRAALPDPAERARLVNEALAEAGRPALPPRALAAALAPLPAGVADLALAVAAALADPATAITPARVAELVRARLPAPTG